MALDPTTFPPARARRQGPTPSTLVAAPGAVAAPPQTRIFQFNVRANAATRSSASSPRLKGPAIIRGIHASKGGAATGTVGWGIGKAASAISESDVAVATAKPFTGLMNALPVVGGAGATPNDTDQILDLQPNLLMDDDSLGIIVLDPEWHLVVYCATLTGGAEQTITGHVNVLEGVSAEALRNFL